MRYRGIAILLKLVVFKLCLMNSISSLIHKFFVLAAAVLDEKDYWIQKVRRSGWKEIGGGPNIIPLNGSLNKFYQFLSKKWFFN